MFKKLKAFFTKKFKQKGILYVLYPADVDTNQLSGSLLLSPIKPITVVDNIRQATEAISRLTYFNNYEHYASWCSLRGLTPNFFGQSWIDYLENVQAPTTMDVLAIPVKASIPGSAMLLRLALDLEPLYVGYENSEETLCYISKHLNENNEFVYSGRSKQMSELDPIYDSILKNYVFGAKAMLGIEDTCEASIDEANAN